MPYLRGCSVLEKRVLGRTELFKQSWGADGRDPSGAQPRESEYATYCEIKVFGSLLKNIFVLHTRDADPLQPLIQASAGQASVSLPPSAMEAGPLIPQNFFNLADLLLDLAGRLLLGAFVFQIWLIGSFSHLLLDLALHFVKLAFRLVFGTWFHVILLL